MMPCSPRIRIMRNSPRRLGRKERLGGRLTAWTLGAARSMCGLWSQDQFAEV
jgi:hypothetical protein